MSFSTKEYFIKETYKSIRRNGFMSFASISTVAVSLLVLGMFLMIFLNTNNLAQYLESQVQVSVYMQDSATDKELAAVKEKLTKMPGVVKVTQVSKQQALERFKKRLGDQEQLLNSLGKDNPFPNSFEVQVDSPERSKEVIIMKYVGATDWFIRWPFLLEGMTLGFFGAVVAFILINSIYSGLLERIHATLAFLPLLPTSPLLLYVDLFLLVAGTGIGALGSYISLRKFLRV